jgi:hypothetical protein
VERLSSQNHFYVDVGPRIRGGGRSISSQVLESDRFIKPDGGFQLAVCPMSESFISRLLEFGETGSCLQEGVVYCGQNKTAGPEFQEAGGCFTSTPW